MGGRNVELVHERWRTLRGDPFRALEWMALKSWDEGKQRGGDPARQFWAGYRSIAYGLGLIEHEDPVDEDDVLSHSHKERVRRAVQKLEEKEAITVVQKGRGRLRTVIDLHLELADVTHLADVRAARREQSG